MEDEDKLLYGDDGGGEKDDEPTQGGSGDTAQDEDTVTFPEEENAVRIYFFKFFCENNSRIIFTEIF